MTKVYIKTDAGRRLIGHLENGVFTSRRKASIHLYQKLNAWGIDVKAYDGMLKDQKLQTIKIHDLENKITYTTDAINFKEHGSILNFKPHRTQVFLPLDYWTAES